MSSATELIAAIATTKHTLFNQIQRLSDYESKLERLLVDVNTTLKGSESGIDHKLTGDIQQTSQKVSETIASLQNAIAMLDSIRI